MKSCLIVDDSAVIRKIARKILENLSFDKSRGRQTERVDIQKRRRIDPGAGFEQHLAAELIVRVEIPVERFSEDPFRQFPQREFGRPSRVVGDRRPSEIVNRLRKCDRAGSLVDVTVQQAERRPQFHNERVASRHLIPGLVNASLEQPSNLLCTKHASGL